MEGESPALTSSLPSKLFISHAALNMDACKALGVNEFSAWLSNLLNSDGRKNNIHWILSAVMYSPYKALWQIPKLIIIAYEEVFIDRN